MGSEVLQERFVNPYSGAGCMVHEESLKVYRDWFSVLSTAEKKGLKRGMRRGMKEGLKAGMERGKEEERLTIARRLKEGGMTDEEVARVTGMEVERVRRMGEEDEGRRRADAARERVAGEGRGRGTSEERRAGEEGGEGDEGGGR